MQEKASAIIVEGMNGMSGKRYRHIQFIWSEILIIKEMFHQSGFCK